MHNRYIIFARWRQCARPFNTLLDHYPKRQVSRFCMAYATFSIFVILRKGCRPISPKIPITVGDLEFCKLPYITSFLVTTLLNITNGIQSAVFPKYTSLRYQWTYKPNSTGKNRPLTLYLWHRLTIQNIPQQIIEFIAWIDYYSNEESSMNQITSAAHGRRGQLPPLPSSLPVTPLAKQVSRYTQYRNTFLR